MRAICAARLSVVSWLHFLADRPQEGRHFSRDRGDRDGLVLPREDHVSIARAEAELTFPRYFANGSREAFQLRLLGSTDPRREAVSPCAFDQHATGPRVPGLSDPTPFDMFTCRAF